MQPVEFGIERHVAGDGCQPPRQERCFTMLAQARRDECRAAELELRDRLEVLEHARQRAVVLEQLRGGLAADPRHAGNIVDTVAHQREKVGHPLGSHTETLLDLVVAITPVGDRIPIGVGRGQQLGEILVAAHDRDRDPRRLRT
jgi:hypothetical protein